MDDDPVELPIEGVLDLHTFAPREIKELVPAYLAACVEKRIFELRIIHGKGTGALRAIVHAILERDENVREFHAAAENEGGWGATIVSLRS